MIDLVESFRIGLFLEPDNVWLNPRSLALETRDYFIKTIGVNTVDKSSRDEYYWAWEKKGVRLIVGIEERYLTIFHFHFELMD